MAATARFCSTWTMCAPLGSSIAPAMRLSRTFPLPSNAATYRMGAAHLDRELSSTEKLTALAHGANFVFAEAAAILGELGVAASIDDSAQVYLDRHGLGGDPRQQAEFAIRILSELPENYPWTKLSLDQAVRRDLLYEG